MKQKVKVIESELKKKNIPIHFLQQASLQQARSLLETKFLAVKNKLTSYQVRKQILIL